MPVEGGAESPTGVEGAEACGRGSNLGEEAGKTGAETGGIDGKVAGMPLVAQAAEEGIEAGVGETLPVEAGDHAV